MNSADYIESSPSSYYITSLPPIKQRTRRICCPLLLPPLLFFMAEAQELQLHIKDTQEAKPHEDATLTNHPLLLIRKHWRWWLLVALSITFLLFGQSAGTLLGRFYYEHGGNSKWIVALGHSAAFPILFLPLLLYPSSPSTITNTDMTPPSISTVSFLYIFLGLLVTGDDMLSSCGLLYLPVSTYSLVCTAQLAFNALFSFYINSQKLTTFILNSLVLVTFSASLIAIHSDSKKSARTSTEKHIIGFICTLGSSAIYSLQLSLTQFSFEKILKKETLSVVLKMQIYPSAIATCISLIGLFASSEWKNLKDEMETFGKGRASYVMTLVSMAVAWQVSAIGSLGLIFEVSSLFSNVVSTIALPLVPILAVIFFHENLDGVKVVAMLMATWGFLSYIYQQYLDGEKSKEKSSPTCT